MVRRFAFTLIELIFAIVIIAITVGTLPMLNQTISKGIDANLVQEAIFAAVTELNEAVTGNWDDHSIEYGTNSYARVINHNGKCNALSKLMPGHINEPLHRRCLNDTSRTPADSSVDANVTSLDDMEHLKENIFVDSVTDGSGYKEKYFSTVDVTRTNVDFNGINPDMKSIVITIRDKDDHILTSLKTYSANIGEIDYYKRVFY